METISKRQTLFLLVETHFLASGNHSFHCLRHFSRSSSSRLVETHFSFHKKKCCFLLRKLLKLLSLLCSLIFQIFLLMLAVFSSNENVFINKFFIPVSENRFFVYLKQYSFIWTIFFSVSGNPNFEK